MAQAGARRLGNYQLLSQLAVGGMAEIYIARTAGAGGFEKLVALKLIHPNYSADPRFVQMLIDEANLSVQLQHPNIVQTFDLGQVDDQYYLAMELIDGVDLFRLLRRAAEQQLPFPWDLAAFITAEVCAGLDYAHRYHDAQGRPLQIVHRDVSPQNVLCGYDGAVKLVDFGIAKAALRGQKTATGVLKGKYYYMSPEQAWGDSVDARSDIFSAGILLYEMLIGQMLYLEEDMDVLLQQVRQAEIPPLSQRRSGLPGELGEIVMRALERRAADRWQTAGELSRALRRLVQRASPDFQRGRLASWVRAVMGDDGAPAESGTVTAALSAKEVVPDDHSLLHRLPPSRPAHVATRVPQEIAESEATTTELDPPPRRRDSAESEATTTELAPPSPRRGDFASNEATAAELAPSPPRRGDFASDEATAAELAPPSPRRGDFGSNEALQAAPSPRGRAAADAPSELASSSPRRSDFAAHDATTEFASSSPRRSDFAAQDATHADPPPRGQSDATRPTGPRLRQDLPATPVPVASLPELPGPPRLPDDEDETTRARQRLAPEAAPPPRPPRLAELPTDPLTIGATEDDPTITARANARAVSSVPPPPPLTPAPPPLTPGLPPLTPASPLVTPAAPLLTPASPPRRWRLLSLLPLVLAALLIALSAWRAYLGPGRLVVTSQPNSATVLLDATPGATATPLTLVVDRRRPHHLRISRPGFEPWESEVRFPTGERELRVQAVLIRQTTSLELTSVPPGAEAIVDGRVRGLTPVTVTELARHGAVTVELRLRGYKAAQTKLQLDGQPTARLSITLEKVH